MKILISLLIYLGISFFLIRGVGYAPSKLQLIFGYLVIYVFIQYFFDKSKRNKSLPIKVEFSGPLKEWPIACYFFVNLSSFLTLLNPFQLYQQLRQILGQVNLTISNSAPVPELYEQKKNYILPFRDEYFVIRGGIDKATSHSWQLFTQRYAYDFVIVDQEGKRHKGKGTHKEDYYCYGKEIVAVADGIVVKCRDGIRDAPFVGAYFLDFLALDLMGNHIIIKHSDDEFSLYAHLIPNSLKVQQGKEVKCGEPIGLCGHSGHSTEPHLHFHFQDRKSFFDSYGLPIRFSDIQVNGNNIEKAHYLSMGECVGPRRINAQQERWR